MAAADDRAMVVAFLTEAFPDVSVDTIAERVARQPRPDAAALLDDIAALQASEPAKRARTDPSPAAEAAYDMVTLAPPMWGHSVADQLSAARRQHDAAWRRSGRGDAARRAQAASHAAGERAQSGRALDAQLAGVRRRQRAQWLETGQGRRRVWTVADVAARAQEREAMLAAGWGGEGSGSGARIHAVDDLESPVVVGRRALELTNAFRAAHGLPALAWHQVLADIGAGHSKDMGAGRVPFGHQGFNARVARYPFSASVAAENVAMSEGIADPAKVAVDGWIDSPGHRKNLLSRQTYCGIGAAKNTQGAWYLTQLFGTP